LAKIYNSSLSNISFPKIIKKDINTFENPKHNIQEVYKLLKNAKRPILLVGQGVKYAQAEA
jgi:thiamine pyrophosphate-dependent acetolactate synthase large subunit-like protein